MDIRREEDLPSCSVNFTTGVVGIYFPMSIFTPKLTKILIRDAALDALRNQVAECILEGMNESEMTMH